MGFIVLVFWAAVGAVIGYAIGQGKGRGSEGAWLGLFLGFIGWIIVGAMSPAASVEQARIEAIAEALRAPGDEPSRECPWCAENIKRNAKVCRYCGRDVEPAEASVDVGALEQLRSTYPRSFDDALAEMQALTEPPLDPESWLSELCTRIEAGSPPHVAASKIPLDHIVPRTRKRPPVSRTSGATDFELVEDTFPDEFAAAMHQLKLLPTPPDRPVVWVETLCERMRDGSPAHAAAARIPLDI